MKSFHYVFRSGKNHKWVYFFGCGLSALVPGWVWRSLRSKKIREAHKRSDWDSIRDRVDYYCRLTGPSPLPPDTPPIHRAQKRGTHVYRFDTVRYTRWFDPRLKLSVLPGDIRDVPPVPSLLKSRPIEVPGLDNSNSVLLKLNAIRHFLFVDDRIPFAQKKDMAVFRGKIYGKAVRMRCFEALFDQPFCDFGDTSGAPSIPTRWQTEKMTISDQLHYKFVLALEGNDVASNLKWVMSSNSLAVSPRMHYETWFMEGRLVPGYHYVEVMDDFSDLEEKLHYYSTHTEEAENIIRHAHEYVEQFRDKKREELIGILVCDKYFRLTQNTGKPTP